MYELSDYLAMIRDHRRVSAYLAAMRATIRPGDVVLELGTGFGYFAVQAARMGAAHVFALEPNDVVDLGPAFAKANGVADRITFVQRASRHFEPTVRADVMLEDMRGVSPLLGARLPSLRDARARLLRADARWVSVRDRLMVAPASAPEESPRSEPSVLVDDGVVLAPVLARLAHSLGSASAGRLVPLSAGQSWEVLELAALESTDAEGAVECTIEQAGAVAGLTTWFEVEFADGSRYSSGPAEGRSVYGCGWLPLPEPVEVRPGDRIAVRMRATFDGDQYVWAWDTTITPGDATRPPRAFRQSNLLGQMRSAERRRRRAASHVPQPTGAGALLSRLFALVDGTRSLEAVARELHVQSPARFVDVHAAHRWAAEELARLEESSGP